MNAPAKTVEFVVKYVITQLEGFHVDAIPGFDSRKITGHAKVRNDGSSKTDFK